MNQLIKFFPCLFLFFMITSCSAPPAQTAMNHEKKGDQYFEQKKYPEASIEFMNAIKATPNDPKLHWKLAQAASSAKDFKTAFEEVKKTVDLDPGNVEALKKLGEFYALAGRSGEAIQIADNLARLLPSDPAGSKIRYLVAFRGGNLDEAIVHLQTAHQLSPNDVPIMLALGNLNLIKGDMRGAKEMYDRALSVDPNSVEAHAARAVYYFRVGEPAEGDREYQKVIDLSQDKEGARLDLARLNLLQGRLSEAEEGLKSLIAEADSQRARKLLAELKIEKGQVAEAKPIIDSILKADEKDAYGKYLKGRIAFAEKRYDEAKVLFVEVLKQDERMASAHLYNGLIEVLQGRIQNGIQELEIAVKINPRDVRAHVALGELHLKANNPTAAESEALEAMRLQPGNFFAAILYGDSFLMRKEWKKAEQVYDAIIRQAPKSFVGYLKMGTAKRLQSEPEEAARFFSKASELEPGKAEILAHYVSSLLAAKQPGKARKVVEDHLYRDGKNAALWEMAGECYLAEGNKKEAEKAFLKSLDLSPESSVVYYRLGMLYVADRRLPEAETRFRTVLEKNPRSDGAATLLGMVLSAQGKIPEAMQMYRKALEISPRNVLAANNLASHISDRGGDLEEALKFAQMARQQAPEDPSVADTLGWIYYKKGLVDLAVPLLTSASVELSRNPVVRYHHGMALVKKGDKEKGSEELRSALRINDKFEGAEEARRTLAGIK